MSALQHVHSFVKYKTTERTTWFKCSDPRCTAVFDRELLIGKISLCPDCKANELILDKQALRRAIPKCIECRKTREGRRFKAAKALMASLTVEGLNE